MDIAAALTAPLLLAPSLRPRVWGGRAFARLLGRELPGAEPVGESWELYDRPDGSSRIAAGPLAGHTLEEVLADQGDAVLGWAPAGPEGRFPLLIKWLDASRVLSVQVHPDEAQARREAGDGGKPEAWVILHADPGATMIRGLRPGATPEGLAAAAAAGGLERWLHTFPVRADDVIWIPPGTVHAMGGGLLIYEVQRNSDVTYRLYDWQRPGLDGKPRPLHLERALATIDFDGDGEETRPPVRTGPDRELLVACDDFRLERLRPRASFTLGGTGAYRVVTLTRGRVRLGPDLTLGPGDTALLPAAAGAVAGVVVEAKSELLVTGPGKVTD